MNDKQFITKIAKWTILLLLAMFACKYTKGGGAIAIVAVAFICTFSGKLGWGIIGYILLPFMAVMNAWVLPKTGITGMVLRVGPMIITIALIISSAQRQGSHALPLGMMWLYLLCAVISSMNGYFPLISYLKIVNFSIILVGLWLGFRNVDRRPNDIETVRFFLLSLSAFLIWGSLILLFVAPGIAYSLSVGSVLREEGLAAASEAVRQSTGVMLFCGMSNQSQALAVMLPMTIAFLACDMFFVERRISKFHLCTIVAGLPLVYLTRSRSALLTTAVAVFIIYFYCLKRVDISVGVRKKLKQAMTVGIMLMILAMAIMEARNHAISKWLRKTEDLGGDQRGLTEAFTQSRMGKVEENLYDFRQNPIFGTGFQVTYSMKYLYGDRGLVFSAPLEKGVLPLMVLGETGVVGLCAFLIFLCVFYGTCVRKRYYTTMTLMTVFITTNMAEATFFSPGGIGGFLWVMGCGGGFVVDTLVLVRGRQQGQMMQMRMM